MSAIALETRHLTRRFGGLVATRDVSFRLAVGARQALIGPNGAGKTTFVNQLTGVLRPSAGAVLLDGRDVTGLSPERRVRLGLARTFQINQLFAPMTPLEALGLAVAERRGFGGDMWGRGAGRKESVAESVEIAERVGLGADLTTPTSRLPYGKQRLLEIGLALACRPRVLLLDEPMAGVPEAERHDILAALAALPAEVAVLLIEHDMDLVFAFASRITVLVEGALFAEGDTDAIAADPAVRAVYLGEPAHG
jgi:branched-chain amino acid transport system ATP-binding protein